MSANLLEYPPLANVQAQQEHPKDVAKVIDDLRETGEEILNPKLGDLSVGTGGVQALWMGIGAEEIGQVVVPLSKGVHRLPRRGQHDGEQQYQHSRHQEHLARAFAEEQEQEAK